MTRKTLAAVALVAVAALGLSACAGDTDSTESGADTSSQFNALAEQIAADQEAEIAEMKRLLEG